MRSLRTILLLLVASGLLAAATLTGASFWGGHSAGQSATRALVAKDVTADILPPPMYLIEMRLVLSQAVEGSMPWATAQAEVARLEKMYAERATYWTQNPPYGLEAQLLGKQHEVSERFIAAARQVMAAGGDTAAARRALDAAHAAYSEHRKGVDEGVRVSTAFADASMGALAGTQNNVAWTLGIIAVLATTTLIALGLWARKTIWSATGGEPAEVAGIVNAIARGDLSVQVPVPAGDSHSVMAAMARMRDHLAAIVGQVRQGNQGIALASTEMAQGNADLSRRTDQQASALEETGASMEQLTATVRQTADNAAEANRLAADATHVAVKGGDVVGQVVETMQGIDADSRKIADIIGVIDGIAFQTNILALNAAVEAARAGEQGRGFAVVASEVRSLASRSAEAAKEIKRLIQASGERVGKGTELAGSAGATMTQIVSAIERVSSFIAAISTASIEQSAGVLQARQAISQMDSATQQNAALVEQSAAAAESLKEQAHQVVQAVALFKLPQPQGADQRRVAAPKASAVRPASGSRNTHAGEPQWQAPLRTGTDG